MLLLSYGCATAYREDSANEAPADAAPADAAIAKRSTAAAAASEAELNDQLTAERLSSAQLRAFERRAEQKLRDFFDYLNLVGNPSLDSLFRAEAAEQATALFANPQAVVRVAPAGQAAEHRAVGPWLQALAQSNEAIVFSSGEPTISRPLTPGDSAHYRGELAMAAPGAGDAEGEARAYRGRVVVKRVAKDFGAEQMQVWEVFLEGVW